jgi:acyl carrier protein
MGEQVMTTGCQICDEDLGFKIQAGHSVCPYCADLLRWFRGFFAHEPIVDLEKITPATTFGELATDSLDYMNWLVEAEEKLGIRISDTEAERFVTVGQFLRHLRLHGAEWPSDYDIRLVKKGGCFSRFRWMKICGSNWITDGAAAWQNSRQSRKR